MGAQQFSASRGLDSMAAARPQRFAVMRAGRAKNLQRGGGEKRLLAWGAAAREAVLYCSLAIGCGGFGVVWREAGTLLPRGYK